MTNTNVKAAIVHITLNQNETDVNTKNVTVTMDIPLKVPLALDTAVMNVKEDASRDGNLVEVDANVVNGMKLAVTTITGINR